MQGVAGDERVVARVVAILKTNMRLPRAPGGRRHLFLVLFVAAVLAVAAVSGVLHEVEPVYGAAMTPAVERMSFTLAGRDFTDWQPLSPPTVTSPAAVLVSTSTGKILFEHNARVRRPMASTTKIMTAILVLENLDLSTRVMVSAEAAATPEPSPWLRSGDVLTVEELLHALLLRSSNAAAAVLAEACAGEVEAFAAEMNARARELGLTDTHFVNPHGLDADGHYSTALDLATLARYAMQNETFRRIVATEKYTVQLPGRQKPVVFTNTNKLLGAVEWVDGIKTGLTPKAEQCLVGSATREGVSVISVILGQPVSNICWEESRALLEYGLSLYKHLTLFPQGAVVADAEVPYFLDGRVELVTDQAVEAELYKDGSVTCSIEIDRSLSLPVETGEVFGQVTLVSEEGAMQNVVLVAAQSYDRVTLGTKVIYYWNRLGRWLGDRL